MRATAFPRWWDVNALRLEGAAPAGLTAAAVAAEADRHLAGLDHRKVEVEDEATGAPLAAGLRELGWHVTRLVWMRRDGSLPAPGGERGRPAFAELPGEVTADLLVEWLLEEQVMPDAESIRAFLGEREAAEDDLPGELVALGVAGSAFVSLRLGDGDGDGDGEIEDAYVTAEARGAGLGTALLHEAMDRAAASGVRDLWIVADADDRPRALYERLGFRAAWVYWDCVRRPPAKSEAPRR